MFSDRRNDGGVMDLNVVEIEVATWAPEDQDRLAAYLMGAPSKLKGSEGVATRTPTSNEPQEGRGLEERSKSIPPVCR
jgi:hypothetical protein